MDGPVGRRQVHQLSGRINVENRCPGRGKKRQLIDRLRRAGVAQAAGTVRRHRDELSSAISRLEHGR